MVHSLSAVSFADQIVDCVSLFSVTTGAVVRSSNGVMLIAFEGRKDKGWVSFCING